MKLVRHLRQWRTNQWAKSYRSAHPDLVRLVAEADRGSQSTGLSHSSYFALHDLIMKLAPATVLECGTGKTTFIIAHALARLGPGPDGSRRRLISLENIPEWHKIAHDAFPFGELPAVEILLRPLQWQTLGFLRGTGYEDVPPLPYDAVFVDGPEHRDEQGRETCNMQFLTQLANSDRRMSGITDKRVSSVAAHRLALGEDKVHFSRYFGLSVTEPVTRADLILGGPKSARGMSSLAYGGDGIPSQMLR